ncbi:MAG: hypothetical protein ACTSQO_15170 [Candidatus Helarchaeota archaeon]
MNKSEDTRFKTQNTKTENRNPEINLYDNSMNINTCFFLEKFILFQRIQILKNIKNDLKEDFKEYSLNSLLTNLFIKKFRLEPGFKFKILNRINNDEKLLRKILRYLLEFLDQDFVKQKYIKLNKKNKEDYDLFEEIRKFKTYKMNYYSSIFNTPFIKNKKKNVFFYEIWKSFINKGLIKEAIATESLLTELILRINTFHMIFEMKSPYYNPQTTEIHFLKATMEIIDNIDFYQYDYLDSQRENLTIPEGVQKFIEIFNYENLNKLIEEIIKHLKDLCASSDYTFIEEFQIKSELFIIIGIIYFNTLKKLEKFEMLNTSFGVNYIIEILEKQPNILSLNSLIISLPDLYRTGILPLFKNYLEKLIFLMQKCNFDDINFLILIKYLCYAYIHSDIKNKKEYIFELIKSNFPIVNRWEESFKKNLAFSINLEIRTNYELLFLLGNISVFFQDNDEFNIIKKIFERLIEKSIDKYEKSKFMVLLSILYRKKMDFLAEKDILNKVLVNKEMMKREKKFNSYEIFSTFIPIKDMISEKDNYSLQTKWVEDLITAEFLDIMPLIPTIHDSYIIYADFRRNILNGKNIVDLQKFDDLFLTRKFGLLSRIAQCISEYDLATYYANKSDEYSMWRNDFENKILMETHAFPNFYLKDFESLIKLIIFC